MEIVLSTFRDRRRRRVVANQCAREPMPFGFGRQLCPGWSVAGWFTGSRSITTMSAAVCTIPRILQHNFVHTITLRSSSTAALWHVVVVDWTRLDRPSSSSSNSQSQGRSTSRLPCRSYILHSVSGQLVNINIIKGCLLHSRPPGRVVHLTARTTLVRCGFRFSVGAYY